MEKDKTAIKCTGIKKHYGENETRIDALKGIDLEVYSGELTILEGPSGSGKSTLLSIITTILTPDAGELFLLGRDMLNISQNQRADFCRIHLGIIFQSLFLVPTLSVVENVSLPLLISGIGEKKAAERSMEVLKKMKMDHRANVSPASLSKGQQQKVAISRAIVNESQIVVCDEPTSSLDLHSGLDTMEIFKQLAKEASKAVLVVTHDHRIFSFADRIVSINDGLISGTIV
jgi:putative ABC transport system ATP-binding protein